MNALTIDREGWTTAGDALLHDAIELRRAIHREPELGLHLPKTTEKVLKALEGRQAALLGNHGLVVVGPSLERALALTVEAETLAMMYTRALQTGAPVLLPEAEILRVKEKFSTYGAGALPPKRVWD